jgi:hypothetical protein
MGPNFVINFSGSARRVVDGTHRENRACAEETFIQAASLFPPDRIRTQALFLARRADAQWRQNDPERACATAHQALDFTEEISSHRAAGLLLELAVSMKSVLRSQPVQGLRERGATILAA